MWFLSFVYSFDELHNIYIDLSFCILNTSRWVRTHWKKKHKQTFIKPDSNFTAVLPMCGTWFRATLSSIFVGVALETRLSGSSILSSWGQINAYILKRRSEKFKNKFEEKRTNKCCYCWRWKGIARISFLAYVGQNSLQSTQTQPAYSNCQWIKC